MAKVPKKGATKNEWARLPCLFPGCNNTKPLRNNNNSVKVGEANKIFHKFPNDPASRAIWYQICVDDSKLQPTNKKNLYVCSDHFSILDYKNPESRQILKTNVIPKSVEEVKEINEKFTKNSSEKTLNDRHATVYTYYGPNSVQMQDGGNADEFVDLETDKAFIITKPNVSLVTTAGYMTKDDNSSILATDDNNASNLTNNISTLDTSFSDLNTDAIMTDINNATGVNTMSTDVDTLATDVESMAPPDGETEETIKPFESVMASNEVNCFDNEIESAAIMPNFGMISNLNIPSSNALVADVSTSTIKRKVSLSPASSSLVTDTESVQIDSQIDDFVQNGINRKRLKISRQDALKCGPLLPKDVKVLQPIPKCIRIANTEENLNILDFPKNVCIDQKDDFIEITPPKKFIKLDKNLLKNLSPIKFDSSLIKFNKTTNSKCDNLSNTSKSPVKKGKTRKSSEKNDLNETEDKKIDDLYKAQNCASFIDKYCSFLTGFQQEDSEENTPVTDNVGENSNDGNNSTKPNIVVNSIKVVSPPVSNKDTINKVIDNGKSETSSCYNSEATIKLSEKSEDDDDNINDNDTDSESVISESTVGFKDSKLMGAFPQKQIRILKFQNIKLRRLLAKERNQLKALRKLYVRKHYEFMDEHLPKLNRDFINSQLRNFRNTMERNYTESDVAFALELYQRSRSLYNYLSTIFALPPREVFVQLFSNAEFSGNELEMMEGVNPQVLENLRLRASQMLENDRVCSLLFAEVSFEDLAGTVNKVLVFMVRGVQKDFQQIVAYFTYEEPDLVAPEALQDVIKSIVISLLECGLKVVALVTNFSEFSYKVFNKLNNNENIERLQLPIVINGTVLHPIFNAPNLLISLLDLFRLHNVYFTTNENCTQYSIAQYNHLLAAFNHDCLRRYPRLTGLTLADFTSGANACSTINTAVRQFSYSMASAIENYALNNVLNREALSTAEFIEILDKLFDSVNSHKPTVNAGKPMTQLLTAESGHLDFWQQMLNILRYWQIGDVSSADLNNTLFGWQITIASVVGIWHELQKMEIKQMELRKFNLEPLESTISDIYMNELFVANPTKEHFIDGMRGVIVDNMFQPIIPEE